MRREIQVAVVDSAGFMRDGLCALLRERDELRWVGAIGKTPQEISAADVPAPDVVLLPCSGTESVATLKRRWPEARILVLLQDWEGPRLAAAIKAGVAGYIVKTGSQEELVDAIRQVALGHPYPANPPSLTEPALVEQPPAGTLLPRGPMLSDREREVMRLIAEGYRTREMAVQLSLSHKTVEKHRSNLMRKLGLRSATAVAAYAITHGYVVLTS